MDLKEELQAAADQLSLARRKFVKGEEGLRHTGLTYSEAKIKYDNCLDEQQAQQHHVRQQMEYAERMHQFVLNKIAQQTATA